MSIPAALSGFLRRWRRLLLALAGLYGAWILAGFFLVPALVKPRLERTATDLLKRPVTLARLRFNPFTFEAALEGLRVAERGGGDWITLRRLGVNHQVWRLLGKTLALATVDLEGLVVRVAVDERGRLNFQDLLELPAPQGGAAPQPAWVLEVGRFRLEDGRVEFTDRSEGQPFRTVLGPVSFRVDGIRTEVGHRSGLALEAWTEAKEHLSWKGSFSVEPLASQGTVVLENLALAKYRPYAESQVSSEIRSGTASVSAQYRFAWGKEGRAVEVTDLSLALKDLVVGERGVTQPAVELGTVELKGRADLLAPSVEVRSVVVSRGALRIQRSREGQLNLERLVRPPRPRPREPEVKPFQLLMREAALRDLQVTWEDRVPERPVALTVEGVEATLRDFSLDPAAKARVAFAARLGAGSLAVEGTVSPFRPAGDLTVKAQGLELAPLDPYLDGPLDLRIASGRAGAEGRLRFDLGGAGLDAAYQGAASLQALELRDGPRQETFLRWKELRVEGADLRTRPLAVAIRSVALAEPEGRLVVEPSGSTNVARALKLPEGDRPSPVTAAAIQATPTAAPDLAIARLSVAKGRLSFIDRSVKPTAAMVLSDLDGAYLGLSSQPEATSKVDFKGKAGGLAPITITGHAMPLRTDLDTDVALRIQGADLTDFTPYTGKYLGYAVQKGKLDVDARLKIERRKLDARSAVKLDQFYLGEKMESPDATGLPVKLGLALLRDRKGVIAFDLPVQGSLDDPDIKYGKLVWNAVFGLLGKIATSPFALIGSLFGGDAGDLSSLAFPPGEAALDAAATAKLQALAKALQERPELRLEAEGAVEPASDGGALRKAALEAQLRRTRARALKLAEEAPVSSAERGRWLQAAYEAAHPPPKPEKGAAPIPPPPPAEMEQRLLSDQTVDPAELAALADARAKAVLAWLLDAGKADPGRVFQVRTGQAKGAAVAFSLK